MRSAETESSRRLLPLLAVAIVGGLAGGMLVLLGAPMIQSGTPQASNAPAPASESTSHLRAAGIATRVPASPATPAGDRQQAPPDDPDAVVNALRGVDDSQRLAALETALAYDVELPAGLLAELHQQPGSEELRLLAFDRHVDSLATDVESARAAMVSATASDSAAVRAEAYRRLEQLEAYEAMLVSTPAQTGSRP